MKHKKHNFYPVIHVKSIEHAIRNATLARECGADGVFLINMGDTTSRVLQEAFNMVYELNLGFRVGINYLTDLKTVPNLPENTMLWSDTWEGFSAGILLRHKFFGPFAFKYQKQQSVDDLPNIELKLDVITTSGEGTGKPPTLVKIQRIHEIATKPIAIASGINAENVRPFKPYVRDFLVGSSIGYDDLIPEKVSELAKIIHE